MAPSTQKGFSRKDKKSIVDLKLSTKSGRIIHIELQVKKAHDMKNRILFYAARLIGEQLKRGQKYDELTQVISIIICDHNLLKEEKSYINVYELRNQENRSFTNLVRLIILELPKLPATKDGAVWPWLRFLTCKREEEYDMLARKHPEIKNAVKCIRRASLIDRIRWDLFQRQIDKMDEQMFLDTARREDREEGHMEGLSEKAFEIAGKMKAMGRPVAEIAEVIGLSCEVIDKL